VKIRRKKQLSFKAKIKDLEDHNTNVEEELKSFYKYPEYPHRSVPAGRSCQRINEVVLENGPDKTHTLFEGKLLNWELIKTV